jgi:hypothetical protein
MYKNNKSNLNTIYHKNTACTQNTNKSRTDNRPESCLTFYESEKISEHGVPLQEDSAATLDINDLSLHKQIRSTVLTTNVH